jgi:prepilin-type N-terminal cleavage/methylation domain-containing protein
MNGHVRSERGLTLVEVLVALAISVAVAASGIHAWRALATAPDAAAEAARGSSAAAALSKVLDEIRSAVAFIETTPTSMTFVASTASSAQAQLHTDPATGRQAMLRQYTVRYAFRDGALRRYTGDPPPWSPIRDGVIGIPGAPGAGTAPQPPGVPLPGERPESVAQPAPELFGARSEGWLEQQWAYEQYRRDLAVWTERHNAWEGYYQEYSRWLGRKMASATAAKVAREVMFAAAAALSPQHVFRPAGQPQVTGNAEQQTTFEGIRFEYFDRQGRRPKTPGDVRKVVIHYRVGNIDASTGAVIGGDGASQSVSRPADIPTRCAVDPAHESCLRGVPPSCAAQPSSPEVWYVDYAPARGRDRLLWKCSSPTVYMDGCTLITATEFALGKHRMVNGDTTIGLALVDIETVWGENPWRRIETLWWEYNMKTCSGIERVRDVDYAVYIWVDGRWQRVVGSRW